MARLISAFLNRSDIPARETLQKSLKALGFRLTVDDAYAPGESSDYLPCTLDGEDAGFQIAFSAVAPEQTQSAPLQATLGTRDCAVKLRWGGDPREHVAALMFAAALATDYGAVVLEDGEEEVSASAQLVDKAKSAFANLDG